MAKLTITIERLAKALGFELDAEQKALIEKNAKVEMPDDLLAIIDVIENTALPNFKTNVKKSTLDEEDSNLDLLSDILGKEQVDKIKQGRGKAKYEMLGKAITTAKQAQIDAKKEVKDAKQDGDNEALRTAQNALLEANTKLDKLAELESELGILRSEKQGYETKLRQKDMEVSNTKLGVIWSNRADVQDITKKDIGLDIALARLNRKVEQEGLLFDLASGKVLKDGKSVVKGGKDLDIDTYLTSFVSENNDLKKMAETQQVTANIQAQTAVDNRTFEQKNLLNKFTKNED
jgi:flagellar hook-basal body complex protein FliE